MKFSVEKALLQNAISMASRAVAAKSSIAALEGLLLSCANGTLTVSGYNMQTGIRTHVEADVTENGEMVLNARLFGEIIRKMPDDIIVFSADEKYLLSETLFSATNPNIPKGKELTQPSTTVQVSTEDNPFKAGSINLTKQGELVRTNPELAKKLASEAGVKLNF